MLYIYDIATILLGFFGFTLAFHIYTKKCEKKPLICPLRSNCETVITSKYSCLMGIPLEKLGMLYYATTVLFHVLLISKFVMVTPAVSFVSIILSGTAVIVSVYLIAIQAFAIKQWCTWCLGSAIICMTILACTVASVSYPIGALFTAYRSIGIGYLSTLLVSAVGFQLFYYLCAIKK
jgi:uncharacterized membrane protein